MSDTHVAFGLLLVAGISGAQEYVISTYAGGASLPTPIAALEAPLGSPTAVCVDPADNIYFIGLNAVFKLGRDGMLTRIAGNSRQGYSGDGGPAVNAQLRSYFYWYTPVNGLAIRDGNLFIADSGNHRVRKVSPDGIISTVVGNGVAGFSGDSGPATDAQLDLPAGLAFDADGNLLIADWGNGRVRKVSAEGTITTVAGVGKCCGSLDDGVPAARAQLGAPAGLAVDSRGNLFISDSSQKRVRKVSPDGVITTFVDNLPVPPNSVAELAGITVDSADNLFITYTSLGLVRKVSTDGTITTVAGPTAHGIALGDGGPATAAYLGFPKATAVDSRGNLYIADYFNGRIRKVSTDGIIATVAGGGTYAPFYADGVPATNTVLGLGGGDPGAVGSLAMDGEGNLYIAETLQGGIRKVSPDGIITTVAATGTARGLAVDGAGALYIADVKSNSVRKVSADGIITTVPGSASDAGGPYAVAVGPDGSLFIGNGGNIKKISGDGTVSIVGGGGMLTGAASDGMPATQAKLYYVCNIAVDRTGNLFIADCNDGDGAHEVTPDGVIHRIALPGLGSPRGVAVDRAGNAFFTKSDSDWDISGGAEQVFKVSPDGNVTVIAGTGGIGYSGDGGPALSAELAGPAGVAVDKDGNVYVGDTYNQAVRVLRPAQGQ